MTNKAFLTRTVDPVDNYGRAVAPTFNKYEQTTITGRFYPTEKPPGDQLNPFPHRPLPFVERSQIG